MKIREKSGFTLLEIIIVVIIVGVLASLALPKLIGAVNRSKGAEALAIMSSLRGSISRCFLQKASYLNCAAFGTELDVTDPAGDPGAHFTYSVQADAAIGYTITATRNTYDGGDNSSWIRIVQDATSVTRSGGGDFVGM